MNQLKFIQSKKIGQNIKHNITLVSTYFKIKKSIRIIIDIKN